MSDQWGQQPTPQQPWQPPSSPNQQPPTPQQPWQPPSSPNQQQWGQSPMPNQQQWGQPQPNAGWQQQPFNPGQFQPPQLPPKKKKKRVWLILGIIVGILVLCGAIGSLTSKTSNTGLMFGVWVTLNACGS